MKLAEAFILRADCLKQFRLLKDRLFAIAKIQEGDDLVESPQDLMRSLEQIATEFADLIKKINKTNSTLVFTEGKTLSDTLAERDVLALRRKMYEDLAEHATIEQNRYSKSEVKFVITINVLDTHKQIDALSKAYRELDSKIQQFNWATDLIE